MELPFYLSSVNLSSIQLPRSIIAAETTLHTRQSHKNCQDAWACVLRGLLPPWPLPDIAARPP